MKSKVVCEVKSRARNATSRINSIICTQLQRILYATWACIRLALSIIASQHSCLKYTSHPCCINYHSFSINIPFINCASVPYFLFIYFFNNRIVKIIAISPKNRKENLLQKNLSNKLFLPCHL